MASAGVNVLRYTALGAGVLYGFSHQRSLTAQQKSDAAQKEWDNKQRLINQAKAEYSKSKQPTSASSAPSGGLNQDINDPKFDLGSYIEGFLQQK